MANLDSLYDDMETPGGNLYIPDRAVDLVHRRAISRNTHYMLTDEEAAQVAGDPRVLACELSPDYLPMRTIFIGIKLEILVRQHCQVQMLQVPTRTGHCCVVQKDLKDLVGWIVPVQLNRMRQFLPHLVVEMLM